MNKPPLAKNGLLVFDSAGFSLKRLKDIYSHIDLFSLSSSWADIDKLSKGLSAMNIQTRILDSARIIDEQESVFRKPFIDWAGKISNLCVDSKPLREHFLLSDKAVSAWWFGLLSDKDPAKSQAFFKIIKTAALISQMKGRESAAVVLALTDKVYQKQIELILRALAIEYHILKLQPQPKELFKKVKYFLRRNELVRVSQILTLDLARVLYLKIKLPAIKKRRNVFLDALLFFTYFPSLERQEKQGRLRNKFAGALQDLCCQGKKTIVWMLNYGQLDKHSFRDSVRLAKRFLIAGEDLFFWQEFIGPSNFWQAILEYRRINSIWKGLKNRLSGKTLASLTGNDFSAPFLIEALEESFWGGYYLTGIIQYQSFKNMFKKISGFSQVLYSCEMQGWEYAFIAAKKYGSRASSIGYQDYAFSERLIQMFHSREELEFKNSPSGIPMPDILAGCGEIPVAMLEKNYGKASNLETLRFRYLNDFLQEADAGMRSREEEDFILLVCTSIDLKESLALVDLVKTAFTGRERGLKIWFKGHPGLPLEKIFKKSRDHLSGRENYLIKEGDIRDFLTLSNVVLVGASSVAVEALAFGCEVIVYVNPEALNLSPLISFEGFHHKVFNPPQLKATMDNLRLDSGSAKLRAKHDFVKRYFNLDPSLREWQNVLNPEGLKSTSRI